jgi:uncharacterized membrane protein SirB2
VHFAQWLQSTSLSNTLQTVKWVIPLLQSIHILMLGIVFASVLMVSLRVLGRVRTDEPFAAVWARFSPWIWTALCVMATTGAILIVAEPVREFSASSFWVKMFLVAFGATLTAIHSRRLQRIALTHADFSLAAKGASIAIVVVWMAVIFLGRAIAYDKEVWGSLSIHG